MNNLRLCLLSCFVFTLHRLTTVSSNKLDVNNESVLNLIEAVRVKRSVVNYFDDEKFLDAHNKYRKLHGCPPLELSAELSDFAQEWANKLAKEDIIIHRSNNIYGENIYWSRNMKLTGQEPVDLWYQEIHDYNFDIPKFEPTTGHFSQLIWKDSKKLGVGVATRGANVWLVANYDPPGNFYEEFEDNVPRLI